MSDRKQRDKHQTVSDVLQAATSLFSEKGLNGTSIRDIEAASGVSKGLIMYHFGTKKNLYKAVQTKLMEEYTEWMASRRDSSSDILEMITGAIQGALTYQRTHPEFRRIRLWSYLEGQEKLSELEKRFTASLVEVVQLGQQSGLVREDIDALIAPFIVRGTIEEWIRREPLLGELQVHLSEQDTRSDQDVVQSLVKILLE
jgi:TetR/AcrR family transcriptional regulator